MQEKWRAVSLAGRLGKERSTAGRRRREGQKGTAALRAAPPLENPAGEARLRRAPQRPWKSPQKAASDEPIGKHRLGDSTKPRRKPPQTSPTGSIVSATVRGIRWQDGWVKKEVRPGGRKMWKREGTARRFAWAGTGARHPFPGRRGKEGQKGTAALRAAPPFQNPAEGRLRRALRRAPPRRHWKSPQKAASDEPFGKHRRGVRTRHPMAGGRVKEEA